MSDLGDWLARGVTYVGVLEGELSDDMGTLGVEGQTQVICDELVPVPQTLEFDDRIRRTVAEQHDEISALTAENARLKGVISALALGINVELCPGRDAAQCRGCVMYRDRDHCAVTDAMDLGIEVS